MLVNLATLGFYACTLYLLEQEHTSLELPFNSWLNSQPVF